MSSKARLEAGASGVRMWALRLSPGVDLKRELAGLTGADGPRAAFVATCVGSLARARLRMPSVAIGPDAVLDLDEPTEIVSLSGTLSPEGPHLHMALSRRDGQCVGGHLLEGCIVRTTAELVIGQLTDLAFARRPDEATGYLELAIERRDPPRRS